MRTELARLNTTAAIRIHVLHSTTESAATFAPVMSLLAFSTSSSTRALKPLERETFSAKRCVALVVRSSSLLRNAGMLSVPLMKGRSCPIKSTIGCCSLGSSSKVERSNSRNACWSRNAATVKPLPSSVDAARCRLAPVRGQGGVDRQAAPLSDFTIHHRGPWAEQLLHGACDLEFLAQQIFLLLGDFQAIVYQPIEFPQIVAQPFDIGLQPGQFRVFVPGLPEVCEEGRKDIDLVRYAHRPLRFFVAGRRRQQLRGRGKNPFHMARQILRYQRNRNSALRDQSERVVDAVERIERHSRTQHAEGADAKKGQQETPSHSKPRQYPRAGHCLARPS